ncbi:hypothetical protein GQ53DRAFT_424221 [Thozetella sp. PMI_491]|nr:hypothetical protein GQ53DRAFT_424221 [Thozetella sp. PMI_491]
MGGWSEMAVTVRSSRLSQTVPPPSPPLPIVGGVRGRSIGRSARRHWKCLDCIFDLLLLPDTTMQTAMNPPPSAVSFVGGAVPTSGTPKSTTPNGRPRPGCARRGRVVGRQLEGCEGEKGVDETEFCGETRSPPPCLDPRSKSFVRLDRWACGDGDQPCKEEEEGHARDSIRRQSATRLLCIPMAGPAEGLT